MFGPLQEAFPLKTTPVNSDLWPVISWRKFWARFRGYGYVPYYNEKQERVGYIELAHDYELLQCDEFEKASDLAVGANNALSLTLIIAASISEFSEVSTLPFAFSMLVFQSAIRLWFNSLELTYSRNRNLNRLTKTVMNAGIFSVGVVGLTALLLGQVVATTVITNIAPLLTFTIGLARFVQHTCHALARWYLFVRHYDNVFEREVHRNQAIKRTTQAIAALAAVTVSALIIVKLIGQAQISQPVVIALAAVNAVSTLYSTLREYRPFKKFFLLRWLFQDVDQKLAELKAESLEQKETRYLTRPHYSFAQHGGLNDELNAIYTAQDPHKDPDALAERQQKVAGLFLTAVIGQTTGALSKQIGKLQQKLATPSKYVYPGLYVVTAFRQWRLYQKDCKHKFRQALNGLINGETAELVLDQSVKITITDLSGLEVFLKDNPVFRRTVLSAFSRKMSQDEALYRAAIRHFSLRQKCLPKAPSTSLDVDRLPQHSVDSNSSRCPTAPCTPIPFDNSEDTGAPCQKPQGVLSAFGVHKTQEQDSIHAKVMANDSTPAIEQHKANHAA